MDDFSVVHFCRIRESNERSAHDGGAHEFKHPLERIKLQQSIDPKARVDWCAFVLGPR